MSVVQIKEELHRYIELADPRMAKALLAMFKKYFHPKEDNVVAYTTKGKPLTKEQIIKEVMDAVEDVERGNYFTNDEIKANLKK